MESRSRSSRTRQTLVRLVPLLLGASSAWAEFTVKIAWDPPPGEPDIAGYVLYWGTESRNYSARINVAGGDVLVAEATGLEEGQQYFFAVRSFNSALIQSDYSEELTYTPGQTLLVQQAANAESTTEIRFQGARGKTYELLASDNLRDWVSIYYSDPLSASGWVTVVENATLKPAAVRFYRLVPH